VLRYVVGASSMVPVEQVLANLYSAGITIEGLLQMYILLVVCFTQKKTFQRAHTLNKFLKYFLMIFQGLLIDITRMSEW
jgi:hypothetical protein